MKFINRGITLLGIICCAMATHAQSMADSTKTAHQSYFKGSVDFLTDAIYNGRKDSVANPYLTAEISYYHKSGLSLSGSLSYQTNNHVFDLFSLDLGYDLDISDQFSASFNLDKPFYNQSSVNVASGIKGSFDAGLTYDTDFITAETNFSSVFSKKTDFLSSGSLSHQFDLNSNDNSLWSIKPEFTINLGTQNFIENYKARKNKGKRTSITSSTVSSGSKFQLLDYELSLPLSYSAKKWDITLLPVYAIPRHPITSITTTTIQSLNKTTTNVDMQTEQLRNLFYAEATFSFRFK